MYTRELGVTTVQSEEWFFTEWYVNASSATACAKSLSLGIVFLKLWLTFEVDVDVSSAFLELASGTRMALRCQQIFASYINLLKKWKFIS